jgi:isopentenyldiphosphate isomerase
MINKDELLFTVDENNNPIEPRPRQEVHAKGIWHRVTHVWIVNDKKELLCQKRSLLKDSSPGKWESFFGGHMSPNMEYLDGAKVEIKEEVGLDVDGTNLKLWKIFKNDLGHEFQGIFVYIWSGDIKDIVFEKEEIDQVKLLPLDEVSKLVLDPSENNWTKQGYEKELFETGF